MAKNRLNMTGMRTLGEVVIVEPRDTEKCHRLSAALACAGARNCNGFIERNRCHGQILSIWKNKKKAEMKKGLITGITGQDRSYLVEFLLEKVYGVLGVVRRGLRLKIRSTDFGPGGFCKKWD